MALKNASSSNGHLVKNNAYNMIINHIINGNSEPCRNNRQTNAPAVKINTRHRMQAGLIRYAYDERMATQPGFEYRALTIAQLIHPPPGFENMDSKIIYRQGRPEDANPFLRPAESPNDVHLGPTLLNAEQIVPEFNLPPPLVPMAAPMATAAANVLRRLAPLPCFACMRAARLQAPQTVGDTQEFAPLPRLEAAPGVPLLCMAPLPSTYRAKNSILQPVWPLASSNLHRSGAFVAYASRDGVPVLAPKPIKARTIPWMKDATSLTASGRMERRLQRNVG
jgi:hypothetical protein